MKHANVVPENHFISGETLEVIISEVISPFKFYVLEVENECFMKEMEAKLAKYYEENPDQCYHIEKGLFCVCLKDEHWYRVKILQKCDIDRELLISSLLINK